MSGWGWKETIVVLHNYWKVRKNHFWRTHPDDYFNAIWIRRTDIYDKIIDLVNLYIVKSLKNTCEIVPFCLAHFFLISKRVAKSWGWDFGQNLSSCQATDQSENLESWATALSGKCQAEIMLTLNITLSNVLATLRLKSNFCP